MAFYQLHVVLMAPLDYLILHNMESAVTSCVVEM